MQQWCYQFYPFPVGLMLDAESKLSPARQMSQIHLHDHGTVNWLDSYTRINDQKMLKPTPAHSLVLWQVHVKNSAGSISVWISHIPAWLNCGVQCCCQRLLCVAVTSETTVHSCWHCSPASLCRTRPRKTVEGWIGLVRGRSRNVR